MQCKKNGVMVTIAVLMACVGLALGFFVSQHMQYRVPQVDMAKFHGTWLAKPRDVAPFDLKGSNKTAFNNASLNHQWTMMFFGFTTCPTICPVTMTELSKMVTLLEEQGVKPLPQVILVSLDPERDTVKKLRAYVTAFNPNFIGARGANEDVVKAMAQEMGVAYAKIKAATDEQNYNIEHTGTIMLFNPQGQLVAFFTMPHDAAKLAEDYQMALSLA